MNNREAVNWLINISADIGKAEHSDLWHYEQALTEIKDMLESAQSVATDTNVGSSSEIPNTSDCISRQAAIDALARIAREKFNLSDEYNHYLAGLMDGELAIKNLPTVQPEPKKGEWSDGYRWQRCSLCKQTGKKSWNYCPNCVADMRGEQDDSF